MPGNPSFDEVRLRGCLDQVFWCLGNPRGGYLRDPIFGDCVPHKRKPATNDLWIFALGPLVIVLPIESGSELWLSFDEVGNPVLADLGRVALRQ